MTTSPTAPPAGVSAARPHRVSGVLCALGGLAFVVLGPVGLAEGPSAPRTGGIDLWMAVAAVAVVLTACGIVAAGRAGDVVGSVAGRIGLGLALLGTAAFAVAHLVAAVVVGQEESPLFPAGQVVAALGMIVLGVAVVRRHAWTGAGRWTPLLCGVFSVGVVMPAFAIFGAPNFPAIAGFGLVWALLGVALTVRR